MNQHREILQKLIKMMGAIKQENYETNSIKCEFSLTDQEFTCYIPDDRLISIRELTRMFIEELNSEYISCSVDDEIVVFIKDMIEWLQSAYNFIIDNKAESSSVKSLKICSQSLNDYKKVLSDSQKTKNIRGVGHTIGTISSDGFEFGRKSDEDFAIVNKSETIRSPEITKKLDEIYESLKNLTEVKPINLAITFSGDEKSNQINIEKLKETIIKYSNNATRQYK
jgi:hypothetical protein